MTQEEIDQALDKATNEYTTYSKGESTILLDGNYTRKELEALVQILKEEGIS